jgi:hypothetical protein
VAAEWVGQWWRQALISAGAEAAPLTVHRGRAVPGPHGSLVCFSGRGPGEVFHRGRKVTGVSQWRSREGALFQTCLYTHWDPAPLLDLLDLGADQADQVDQVDQAVQADQADQAVRLRLRTELAISVCGLEDLGPAGLELDTVGESLLHSITTMSPEVASEA